MLRNSCVHLLHRVMLLCMNTDARMTALRYYACSGRNAAEDVAALMHNPQGVFLFTPDLVVMMKPADSKNPAEWGKLEESPSAPDGWYVHLLCGKLQLARKLAWMLPAYRWVCFQRGARNARTHRMRWARVRL